MHIVILEGVEDALPQGDLIRFVIANNTSNKAMAAKEEYDRFFAK
jgi:hypothetical protein